MFDGEMRDGHTGGCPIPIRVEDERLVRPVERSRLPLALAVPPDEAVGVVVSGRDSFDDGIERRLGTSDVIDAPERLCGDVAG